MKERKINILNILILLFFISSILYDLFSIQFFSYFDEIFGSISTIGILIYIILKKKTRNDKVNIKKILVILFLFIVLGIVNYILSDIKISSMILFKELFLFLKQYLIFVYILIYNKSENNKLIIRKYVLISKLLIIILLTFAVINSFYDLNMTSWDGSFKFLGNIGETVASWTLLFLLTIMSFDNKKTYIYFFISSIIIFYAKSGVGYFGISLLLLFHLLYNKKIKFHWYYLLVIVPSLLFISQNEINTYIINENSPRAKLFHYSIITANDYFPLGSGVGTYGSPNAIENYSPLYIKYGFDRADGMNNKDSAYLMDCYYPRVIAEFGYLGLLLYIILIYTIVFKMILKIQDIGIRRESLILIILLLIVSIGFVTSGCWGCVVYMMLGLLLKSDKNNLEGEK